MKTSQTSRSVFRRALGTLLHLLLLALRWVFLLMLIIVPVPITLRPRAERTGRQNLPTDVLKKE